MGNLLDITGQKFGMLHVVRRVGSTADKKATWQCVCDCGAEKLAIGRLLVQKLTTSCGCQTSEKLRVQNTRHGRTRTPTHNIWKAMRSRCNNPNNKVFASYGGRGIRVCDRWNSFERFTEDMGPRPTPRHSVERIDNNGNYEPGNCRWATQKEQGRNKRNNRFITARGVTLTCSAWSELTGIKRTTITQRIDSYGWSAADAVSVRP